MRMRGRPPIVPAIENPHLQSWVGLQKVIAQADEEMCDALLREELAGRKRYAFLRRIHSRMNRLRAQRERDEINRIAT
jgi:hypothetical protein